MSKFIRIVNGRTAFTGRFSAAGWSIFAAGERPQHFRKLSAAKIQAVSAWGASGKWSRRQYSDGAHTRTEYTDAKPNKPVTSTGGLARG